ncbi:hypothetical protein [Sphingobacterium multivorum]|uniref:hypothetical protein n=1 Tax=Sphingobacterium multivorum TaxID=28454 RepID=UPI0028B11D8F|nr:hypothetical protein [Sphingobacterium multivorum]
MNQKDFIKYLPLGFLVLFVLTLPLTGILLYNYWKGFINEEHGYNGINTVIAYAGGVINLITIIFLYINYIQQKEQIKKQDEELKANKEDSEFNRALTIIYQQLEYSKNVFQDNLDTINVFKKEIMTLNEFYNILYYNSKVIRFMINIKYEITLIERLLAKSQLSTEDKQYFNKIFPSNIPYDYKLIIYQFIKGMNLVNDPIQEYRIFIFNNLKNRYLISENDVRDIDDITDDMVLEKYGDAIKTAENNFLVLKECTDYINRFFIDNNIWNTK